MISLNQRRGLSITVLAVAGLLLGACSGWWLGRTRLLRNARVNLSDYAVELVRHSDAYALELTTIRKAFNPSPYPFCSDQEIKRMQVMTFNSLYLKEIGRIGDRKLYCSAFLGRLNPPLNMPRLKMALPGGLYFLYDDIPLIMAGSTPGSVIATSGVDFVLSPHAYDYWGQPNTRYMVAFVDRSTGRMEQVAGAALSPDPHWVMSGGERDSDGKMLLARCSQENPVCVVAERATGGVLSQNRPLLIEYCALGGFAGFGIGLAIGQFYLQRSGLAQQLRRAIRARKLHLVYQPILELPTRSCAGAEALVRWSDEDGNAVSPDIFIRIAEDRGFIGEITAFVIRRSLEEVGDILRANPELTLSINISASDLQSEALFRLLDLHVRQAGIAPEQVALELTERSSANLTDLREAILRLHIEGYQVHIDDFGTGYSSLAYLHELAVDAIKVDRAFTRTIGTDAVTVSILPLILSLAESLHVEVIVEGVETEEQAQFLISSGKVMQAQGWHFGKPVKATELPKYREQAQYPAKTAAGETTAVEASHERPVTLL